MIVERVRKSEVDERVQYGIYIQVIILRTHRDI